MTAEWWRKAVVYQVYPRSFADSNGDGIGDIRGIIEHLDHLEALGVDVIWLSPVYESPHDDNGYDISDYYAIDPVFGTLEDLDELVDQLHQKGMRLIMDLVVNHTSDEHPWFIESRSSRSSPKRDWYWWRGPRADGGAPNNWRSFFSGSAWQNDAATNDFYLHLFSPKQPDLNWENAELRRAIYSMMNWWLDRGIDGFRMDVINFISKDSRLPDGTAPDDNGLADGWEFYSSGPRIHEFLKEMHAEVFSGRKNKLLTVGEMPGVTTAQAELFTDPSQGELDMVFQFEHVGLDHGPDGKFSHRPLRIPELKASFARWQEALLKAGWNSLYWNNHDQPRVVSRYGDPEHYWYESATALATALHLQRGTPYIYQGEELGMTNMPFESADQLRDIESLNFLTASESGGRRSAELAFEAIRKSGRDNARTPMQWSSEAYAGFSRSAPWIDVNPNFAWLNAAAQRSSPNSVFAWYCGLIALRHSEPILVNGRFELLDAEDEQTFVFTRTTDDAQLLVAINLSDQCARFDSGLAEEWASAEVLLHNSDREVDLSEPLSPWEAIVMRRHVKSVNKAMSQM